jgi:hypothetical protein
MDVVVIDGKELRVKDHPELIALIESGRSQEKEKLHSQIEEMKLKIKSFDSEGVKTKAQLAQMEEYRVKLEVAETREKELKEQMKNIDSAKNQVVADRNKLDTKVRVKDALSRERQKLEEIYASKLQELEVKMNKQTASMYRETLLERYKGLVIPELIEGNSVEELDKSAEKALSISKKYITKNIDGVTKTLAELENSANAVATDGSGSQTKVEQTVIPVTPIKVPGKMDNASGNLEGKDLLENMADMTPEEFAKNREKLRAQLLNTD